jgi:glutamine synthetase
LRIVQRTAEGLGLPLASLEIELGPSQVEAVFDATDALTARRHMVAFRNGVTQALRRAGYHASFVCRPPFPNVMASGWHLHQSLRDLQSGANAFGATRRRGSGAADAQHVLSAAGERGSPDCWSTAARWPCSARRRSTPTAASGRTRWRRTR